MPRTNVFQSDVDVAMGEFALALCVAEGEKCESWDSHFWRTVIV